MSKSNFSTNKPFFNFSIKSDSLLRNKIIKIGFLLISLFITNLKLFSSDLHLLCQEGNLIKTELLLKKHCDPNIQDKDGLSPLHIAAINNNFDLMRLLLTYSANTNLKDNQGNTFLHYIAQQEYNKICILLDKILDFNSLCIENKDLKAPVDIIIEKRNYDDIQLLLDQWLLIDPKLREKHNQKILLLAIEYRRIDLAKVLINNYNLDINHQYNFYNYNLPIILVATLLNELDIIKALINNKADATITYDSNNILHYAAMQIKTENYNPKILIYLIKLYPELLIQKNKNNMTPLDLMFFKLIELNQILKILNLKEIRLNKNLSPHVFYNISQHSYLDDFMARILSFGYKINTKNTNKHTALNLAIINNDIQSITNILKHNPSTSIKDNLGNTPLQHACKLEQEEIVKILLQQKDIDINSINKENHKAIDIAALNGNITILKLILDHKDQTTIDLNIIYLAAKNPEKGKDTLKFLVKYFNNNNLLNISDIKQNTSLHLASSEGDIVAIKNLISAKANINAKNKFQQTPLHIACLSINYSGAQELCDHTNLDILSSFKSRRLGIDNCTALHLAIHRNNINLLEILLNHPNIKSDKSRNKDLIKINLASFAFDNERPEISQYLISSIGKFSQTIDFIVK